MEENITESKTVQEAVEVAVVAAEESKKAELTLDQKFEALVQKLALHGIHLS